MNLPIALYALTPQGALQALRVCAALCGYAKKENMNTGKGTPQNAKAKKTKARGAQTTIDPLQIAKTGADPKATPGVTSAIPRVTSSPMPETWHCAGPEAACHVSGCISHVYIPKSLILAPDLATSGVFKPFSRLSPLVKDIFHQYRAHIFITATGIAVRSIAPLLESKQKDPAVLVIDQKGQFIISLVSGHLGGANALTIKIAAALGATPIITTATDLEGVPSIDSLAVNRGLVISNGEAVKKVSAALVAGSTVPLYDPDNWLDIAGSWQAPYFQFLNTYPVDTESPCIIVTTKTAPLPNNTVVLPHDTCIPQASQKQAHPASVSGKLVLHPPALVAGIGCKRNTPAEDILRQITFAFQKAGHSLASLCCLASASVKKNEPGLLETAKILKVPLYFFSLEELSHFPVSAPSARCQVEFSVKGICEPAALAAAGDGAILIQPKTAGHMVTVAITQKKPGPPNPNFLRQTTPL